MSWKVSLLVTMLAATPCFWSNGHARAAAQPDAATWEKHYGAQAGINLAWLRVDPGETDHRLGWTLGGFMRYGHDVVAIQPEIALVERGAVDRSITYVEATGLFKFVNIIAAIPKLLGEDNRVRSMLYVGPTVGVKVATTDVDNAKRFHLGMALGLDSSLRVGRMTDLVFDGRFLYGLTDVAEGPRAQHLGVVLSVGFLTR